MADEGDAVPAAAAEFGQPKLRPRLGAFVQRTLDAVPRVPAVAEPVIDQQDASVAQQRAQKREDRYRRFIEVAVDEGRAHALQVVNPPGLVCERLVEPAGDGDDRIRKVRKLNAAKQVLEWCAVRARRREMGGRVRPGTRETGERIEGEEPLAGEKVSVDGVSELIAVPDVEIPVAAERPAHLDKAVAAVDAELGVVAWDLVEDDEARHVGRETLRGVAVEHALELRPHRAQDEALAKRFAEIAEQ